MRWLLQLVIPVFAFVALVGQVQGSRFAEPSDKCAGQSPSKGNRDEAVAESAAATEAWSGRLRAGFGLLRNIDAGVIRVLGHAWEVCGAGASGREGVVLFFLSEDGSYRSKLLGATNEYKKFCFNWNPAIVAIVHTHPDGTDPRPSEQDKRVAEGYSVAMFTITRSGMYAYDPATKVTTRVLYGFDWLKPSSWTPDVYRALLDSSFRDHGRRRIRKEPCAS